MSAVLLAAIGWCVLCAALMWLACRDSSATVDRMLHEEREEGEE